MHWYRVSRGSLIFFTLSVNTLFRSGQFSNLHLPFFLFHNKWCTNQKYLRFHLLNRARCTIILSADPPGCILFVSTSLFNCLSILYCCLIPLLRSTTYCISCCGGGWYAPLFSTLSPACNKEYVSSSFNYSIHRELLQKISPIFILLMLSFNHAIQYNIFCTHYWKSY